MDRILSLRRFVQKCDCSRPDGSRPRLSSVLVMLEELEERHGRDDHDTIDFHRSETSALDPVLHGSRCDAERLRDLARSQADAIDETFDGNSEALRELMQMSHLANHD